MSTSSTYKEKVAKLKTFFTRRKSAYHQVFNPENVYTQLVLEDLAKFCRANESTFHPNSDIARQLDGRREVWLRIQQHLNLTTDELFELYGQRGLNND